MPDSAASDFVFRVEGVRLSAADRERISQAISAAVSGEMARIAKPADLGIIRPFPWPGGIWIRAIRDLAVFDRVAQLGKAKPTVNFGG